MAGCCIQSNSGQRLTDSQMVCSDTEECLQRILFPLNTKLRFWPSSDLSFVRLKDNLWKIPRHTIHVPQAVLQCLYSGHRLLHTGRPSSSTQAVPASWQSCMFPNAGWFPAYYAEGSFLNSCKAKVLWSTAEHFPYLCFFSLKPAEMNHLVGPSSSSVKNTDIRIVSNVDILHTHVSYTPSYSSVSD